MPRSKNGNLYYTEEQYQKARYDSSAYEYAVSQGYELVPKGNYYVHKDHDSMVFTKTGQWYWNSRDMRGGAIEFITHYEHKTIVEAVLILSGESILSQDNARTYEKPKEAEPEKGEFVLPERNSNHHRVYAYLTKHRGIDEGLIQTMLSQRKIYETAKHHNAAFVFQNAEGRTVGAFMRSTLTYEEVVPFYGMAKDSDKKTGCFYFGNNKATVACVSEACIDSLSYATIQMRSQNAWEDRIYIASGGTGYDNVLTFLKSRPLIDTVILCQDNDRAGHTMAQAMGEILIERGYLVNRATPIHKDHNEDLTKMSDFYAVQEEGYELPAHHGATNNQEYPDDIAEDLTLE